MNRKIIISDLIILNLIAIFLMLISKFSLIHEFISVVVWIILVPIIFGTFLYYILRPLNNLFIRKGLKKSKAAGLTLLITAFILAGIIRYFGGYLFDQLLQLKYISELFIKDNDIVIKAQEYIKDDTIKTILDNLSTQLMGYINFLISNAKYIFEKGMMLFSNVLLIILITFFLLRDGDNFKEVLLKYCPGKFKDIFDDVLTDGDNILSTYIIGQAVVAISLATMIFVGYLIIGMPSALLLSFTTFILAFIPFVGFFISMIIPFIIAISLGINMVVKLSVLFIIAQTLKGRMVVPFIMGKAMKIHPITDIFLVVGAATIGGPVLAFCIVPIYSLVKLVVIKLKEDGYLNFKVK